MKNIAIFYDLEITTLRTKNKREWMKKVKLKIEE